MHKRKSMSPISVSFPGSQKGTTVADAFTQASQSNASHMMSHKREGLSKHGAIDLTTASDADEEMADATVSPDHLTNLITSGELEKSLG